MKFKRGLKVLVFTSSSLFMLFNYHLAEADWVIENVDSTYGSFSSIALDKNNNPHISYRGSWDVGLKYAYHDETGWHMETVDSSSVKDG